MSTACIGNRSVVSNLRTGPKRTGPDQLPKIRTEGPDYYINCCRHVCNAYGYAPSNQIPIFFPNYHVVTVTACISIDSIRVLHGEKTIAGCRNIGLYSYIATLCVKYMDVRNPGIVLRKVSIDTLRNKYRFMRIPWIVRLVFCSKYG